MPFLPCPRGLLCPSLQAPPLSRAPLSFLSGCRVLPSLFSFRHTSKVRFKHSEYPVFGFVCGEGFLKLPAPNFKVQGERSTIAKDISCDISYFIR